MAPLVSEPKPSAEYSGGITSSGDTNDHTLAAALAVETGEKLVKLRDDLQERGDFGGWYPEEQGDALGHELLTRALAAARPADGVLSEEGHDDGHRLRHDRVWIVDPLDGSNGYGYGSNEWAIHVALCTEGKGTAAAVSLPAIGVVFGTGAPATVPEPQGDRPVVVTGRSRVRYDGVRLAEGLDAELMSCGSSGVKAMLVVTGQADVYVHGGPLWEWDVCAPAVVAQAAGLHVSDAFGEPLVFNKERAVSPGFVVCRPEFADRVIDILA